VPPHLLRELRSRSHADREPNRPPLARRRVRPSITCAHSAAGLELRLKTAWDRSRGLRPGLRVTDRKPTTPAEFRMTSGLETARQPTELAQAALVGLAGWRKTPAVRLEPRRDSDLRRAAAGVPPLSAGDREIERQVEGVVTSVEDHDVDRGRAGAARFKRCRPPIAVQVMPR
jgi:hypothetical protein